ncbi:MAG: hypothetical protein ICCCNLDF_02498 [Planctomycetes bacterium]|nr:hypothetical protein [Planctomycetota bacterium]
MRFFSLAAVLSAVILCNSLSAQASINLSGTVPDDRSFMYLVEVDFGSTPQSVTLDVSIGATSGTSGIDISLIDLDELAANGTTNGVLSGSNAGTTPVVLNMTTPSYSGVHQFVVEVETDAANGPSPFTGTFACSTLTAGTIVLAGSAVWPFQDGYTVFFNRAARFVTTTNAAGTYTRDVVCDFGTMAQAATFWVQGLSFFADGTVEVYEVLSGGTENLLGTLNMNSGTGYEEEGNFTTSARSGPVTIRLKIITTLASTEFYAWTIVMPSFVSVSAPGGGGGGGGDDGGCSTGGTPGLGLLLIGMLAALGLGARLRGSRLAG